MNCKHEALFADDDVFRGNLSSGVSCPRMQLFRLRAG
jgi:hypothetical protein